MSTNEKSMSSNKKYEYNFLKREFENIKMVTLQAQYMAI